MKEWLTRHAPMVLLAVGAGIWLTAFLLYDSNGYTVLVFCGLAQLLQSILCGIIIQRFYRLANMDGLTGVCNRRCFFLKISGMHRLKFPVSLMMIDIDNFKKINDNYGHQAGDKVLEQFAETLKSSIRSTDIAARLGGEEFAILLPSTSYENARKMAERIKQNIEAKTFKFDSMADRITVSIGVATAAVPINHNLLLKYADMALYKAKETRSSVISYEQLEDALVCHCLSQ